MKVKLERNNVVLMLQSGGRDSAVACVRLLEKGYPVHAITFLHNSSESIKLPRKRAQEIFDLFPNYSWAAVDYTAWESEMKTDIKQRIGTVLPRSCLICAIARLTASFKICNNIGSNSIAVGYTGYQSSWAEQTPLAIKLQKDYLCRYGYELLVPAQDIDSKKDMIAQLSDYELTTISLENSCCVASEGTQFVNETLTQKAIELCFDFASLNTPALVVKDSLGEMALCL